MTGVTALAWSVEEISPEKFVFAHPWPLRTTPNAIDEATYFQ